ncbi:MAG: TspO/MBR family protein, partial [Pseudomonadota bacterium]
FAGLEKPGIFPPPATFGIVWAILYAMIGFSVALIASSWGAYGRNLAIGLFVLHFAFNLAWTPVFFGMQNIVGGLIVMGLVVITLLAVIWAFWRVRKVAALLLLPYLAWAVFATVLNYQFLSMNPDGGQGATPSETQRIEI